MIVPDSSAWISYLMDQPAADAFAEWLKRDEKLVPTIVLYEVCKWMRREVSPEAARAVAAHMYRYPLVPFDESVAYRASVMSSVRHLAMADAIIYTTAQLHNATLVTGDAHFRGLPDVEYISAPSVASGSADQ